MFPITFIRHSGLPSPAQTYNDAPTRCFDSLSTAEIHSPSTTPLIRVAALWVFVFNRSLDRHRIYNKPLCTNDPSSNVGPKTLGLLAALGYQPRTSTSLSLPSGLDRDHCQAHGGETTLGSTNLVRLRPDNQRGTPSGAHDRSEGLAFPSANQADLTSVSSLVLLITTWASASTLAYDSDHNAERMLGPAFRLRLHRWAFTGGGS